MSCRCRRRGAAVQVKKSATFAGPDVWTAQRPMIYFAQGGTWSIVYQGEAYILSPEAPLHLPAGQHTFLALLVEQTADNSYCWAEPDLEAERFGG